MNAQQQLQLEDAQKKLSIFRKHLDLLARCTGESKNVDPNEVLSAVAELQSLVEWAAQQPELGAESTVLLVKLQELHQIRENLEKTSPEVEEVSDPALNYDDDTTVPEQPESYSKDLEYISDIVAANFRDNNGDNLEDDTISMDKDSLGDFSASTEDPNLANAESPQSIEDTNVEIIPSDDKVEHTISLDETNDSHTINEEKKKSSSEEILEKNPEIQEISNENKIENTLIQDISKENKIENPEIQEISKDNKIENPEIQEISKENKIDSLEIQEISKENKIESPEIQEISKENKIESPEIQEISKENKIESPEIQEISKENKIENPDILSNVPEIRSPNLFRSEVIIIETDEDNKSTEWVDDSKNSNDPLDVCMYAIKNLYESLRVKENELLKLSAMQNDQKHIEALQAVIIEFHKDITNLNTELEKSKKENAALKEQVLELEEAENDARSEAQKLEQKLVFLQEKDSHSQAELTQLKQTLKKYNETLAEKEELEKELRSQIKYMDTLVQKYEDQIKMMEVKETASSARELESLQKQEVNSEKTSAEKRLTSNKGTQTYQPRETKINCNGETSDDSKNADKTLGTSHSEVFVGTEDNNTEGCHPSTSSIPSTTANESTASKEQSDFVNIESISQQELLKRLHKLIDEDVSLQQQIHYVDEINLAMWKKLQNLDNHIGECKRQNINETNPSVSENDLNAGCGPSETEIQEPSADTSNQNIPEENLSCLDQNEQYIQERLQKLEEINASFEKELKTRENLCKEKEKKYEEWIETEKRIMDDLKRFEDERDWIKGQITKLRDEQEKRQGIINKLEEEINAFKEKTQLEVTKITSAQETTTEPLNFKVNQLLIKEKDILKMISNLKSEKNRSQGKSELERLKCRYIELQIELSQAREEIQNIQDAFKVQIDQCTSKHLPEITHRTSEIDRLRNENTRFDKMITNLELKQSSLLNALENQEKYLQTTRESYKKNLEETEEEHRSVETELKSQLQQIEEGTAIATTALMEERMKTEKELQENIRDLKAKEEVYKAKIAELESDVIHLHEELHKITNESESRPEIEQLHEPFVEEDEEKIIEVPFSKTDLKVVSQIPPQSEIIKESSIPPSENIPKEFTAPKLETVNTCKGNLTVKDLTEENVDELRAQVRELQSELDKISEEEIRPVQPVKPITAKSLKTQKVEDIDYAEVDECSLDAWRKNAQNNILESATISRNVQAVYGDKYSTGYKDNLQNERVSVNEAVEESDYDEVLPRPTNFHVVQQVGSDTLLVGWNYVNPSVLDGFEVYLDDQVHERIYIPDRTKALISGLNLRKPIRLSIYALSRYGQMSEPAVLELSSAQGNHTQYLEDEDEYRDIEDPMKRNQRPYSMEW